MSDPLPDPFFQAPFKPMQAPDVERAKANALEYIAAQMGMVSASFRRIEDRLEKIENVLKMSSPR